MGSARSLTLAGLGPLGFGFGFGRRSDPSLWREVALRAHLTRIYRLSEGPNARWSNTGSSRNGGTPGYGFHLSLESAQARASDHLLQGSYWEIDEVPACAFIGASRSLLIAEPHTASPLARHSYGRTCKPYLIDIAARFHELNPGLIHSFIASTADLPVADPPFRSWISASPGPDQPLSWRAREFPRFPRHDLGSMRKAIQAHQDSLDACAFFGISLWNHPERSSLTIHRLDDRSPLAAAGLINGDVIVSVEQAGSEPALKLVTDRLEGAAPGDQLTLRIRRGTDHFRLRYSVKSFSQVFRARRVDAMSRDGAGLLAERPATGAEGAGGS